MESWASRSPSSTNITRSNLKSSVLLLEISEGLQESNPIQGRMGHTSMGNCDMAEYSSKRCNGLMGVPITFLDKFNPDQFEILDMWGNPKDTKVNGKSKYARIIVRKRSNTIWKTGIPR